MSGPCLDNGYSVHFKGEVGGGWGVATQAIGESEQRVRETRDGRAPSWLSTPGGLSPLSSSGWTRMRKCPEISCMEPWRETRRMG